MFKQLYLRLAGATLLVVLLGLLLSGCISLWSSVSLYITTFEESMEDVAQSNLPRELGYILTDDTDDTNKLSQAEQTVSAYAGKLQLNENRSYYILSARDASIIAPSVLVPGTLTITPNLSDAMKSGNGDNVSIFGDYLDYATFIKNGNNVEDGFIFYVRDNKTDLQILIRTNIANILWSLLIGFLLSLAIGFLMAYNTVKPLRQISKRIDNFAQGNYEPSLEKVPEGEIGELIKTFNRIGTVMSNNLTQIDTEKHKVEVILERINNGIIAFDTNQKVIHINSAAKELFNITNAEKIEFNTFFSTMDSSITMAEFMYLESSTVDAKELIYNENHIKTYIAPFKMDNERIAGVVCVFEDVSEQFNLENARQKFVAEVSHELKTPLNIIRNYTETLLNGYLDDKKMATGFLNTVINETDKMTALVQNLLILNRFDMQRVDIKKEPFSLDLLLRKIVDTFELEAEQKGLSLKYNRTTDIPDILADQYQIERAIKNIVSNSIKYCSKGDKIQIFSGVLYNSLYIKVEDSGKGIPKADLEHVFERFYRVDKDRNRDKGGTGLGLPITKEIIESHGGKIEIESDYGKFTRATITFPISIVAKNE